MGTTDGDLAEIEAREKAAALLRGRHERESQALGTLMAAVSRRALAAAVVEKETEQILSGLTELSQFGFDDATLAELGIDIAHIRRIPGLPPQEGAAPDHQPAIIRSPVENDGAAGQSHDEVNADSHAGEGEHASGVRTTAHLTGRVRHPRGATTFP